DTLFITEVSPNFATLSKVQQVIYTSYSEYYITVPFIVEGDGGTTVINNHVTFPYQGSGNKDSLFFFSNLEKMELSALFKRK
ncbi:MAG TPA: hypothetical protein VK590_15150, partial [Saprospiraceae bacterium]|nr:hypothetical protein [Saprospiraceae bacterium]